MRLEAEAPKRILLLVAHPDDETIAAGAHLHLWPEVTLIQVTDGAPRDGSDASKAGFGTWQDYAAERQRELGCALRAGECLHVKHQCLGIADQAAVENIPRIVDALRSVDAEIVITHAYEGGHPDHDACAFAAAEVWGDSGILWEFAGYHNSSMGMETACFLFGSPSAGAPFPVLPEISGEALRRKRAMLECFRTQRDTLAQFRPELERFRPAPVYDFTRAPHAGPLMYETWGFELTGEAWRKHVAHLVPCR